MQRRKTNRPNKKGKRSKAHAGKSRALCAAASALHLIGACASSSAQGMPEAAQARFQYSYYQDWQAGTDERMTVHAPMVWFETPVAEKTAIEAGFVVDTMSGASPLYHDTLSGASDKGVEDERNSGDLTVSQYFDDFSLSLGGVYSTEEDYDSQGGNVSSRIWTPDKNTTFLIGLNANHDRVRSSNNSEVDELKRSYGGVSGVTQILDKNSVVQSNLSYGVEDGYLTDPYKSVDNRPASRDRFAWLTRYVRYIESASASLHADYRFYLDSWSINAHTLELAWYQPLGEEQLWMVRPRLRYYSQSEADFYSDLEPIEIFDERFYTADQRLSGFGSVTMGLKLIREFEDAFSANISYDFVITESGLAIGSQGSPGIEELYLSYVSIGFAKKF